MLGPIAILAVFGLALTYGAVRLGVAGLRARRFAAQLAKAPLVPIADVVPGSVVALRGTVTDAPSLVDPLEGKPCVYWRVSVSRQKRSDGDVMTSESFQSVRADEALGGSFVLRDEQGGRARVVLGRRGVEGDLDRWASQGRAKELAPEALDFLRSRGINPHSVLGDRAYRVEVERLLVGSEVTVIGRAERIELSGGLRDAAPPSVEIDAPEWTTTRPPGEALGALQHGMGFALMVALLGTLGLGLLTAASVLLLDEL